MEPLTLLVFAVFFLQDADLDCSSARVAPKSDDVDVSVVVEPDF